MKVGLMQLAVDGQPLGPQDLRFDSEGMLWFTEVLPGKLGMFDPATGSLTELAVPVIAGKPPARYEFAIDRRDSI